MASTYNEKTLTCSECGAEFVHSVADQQRYAERGFTSDPKRCPTCRQARRAQQQRGPRQSGGNWRGGGEGDRGRRQSYPVVCSSCGKETTVPFQPRGNRPVYCRECYQAQRDSS